jgi:hypothetical protein
LIKFDDLLPELLAGILSLLSMSSTAKRMRASGERNSCEALASDVFWETISAAMRRCAD